VREGSSYADPVGEILSAMGIALVTDAVPEPPSAPLHVRPRATGPGPNRVETPSPRRYAPDVTEHASLGASSLRALAERHGVSPKRSLGQHFLVDPNLARAIAADAGAGPGTRVVEIGAGLGSLTRALAETGADVVAIELDRALLPALEESVGGLEHVRVVRADAMAFDWLEVLEGGSWVLAANLPYNLATPLVLETLRRAPAIRRLVVMVQREVGERLAAGPGEEGYGAPSVRVAYRAEAAIVRRVPAAVFWPRPNVESVVVALDRRERPPVGVEERALWRVVDAGFAERRKTMRNAVRRIIGGGADEADRILARAGIEPSARAETLSLEAFVRLAEAIPA
jgi:16S rRNA (adenine1518-N6/adenine1519-N6)-dimethyltransferase